MGFTQPDGASSPENFAGVATQGMNIQAPLDDLSAVAAASTAIWGGLQNPSGPREQQAQAFMDSAQGYGEFDVTAGFAADWPNNAEPPGM